MDSESLREYAPSFRLPEGAGKRGVIVMDADHRVAFTDAGIFHLLGVEPGTMLGQEVGDALKDRFESPQEYESSCLRLIDNPEEVLDDVLELAGEKKVIHRYSAPLHDASGAPSGRVEIYSDITKRRELESAARDAFQELKETQDQLVQSEKLRAVGEIASGVAHDFNNTLGIILGNIQLLLRKIDDPAARRKLESAQQAAQDGVDTVRRIQEFTRKTPEEAFVALDLSRLAAEVVEMMRPVLEKGVGEVRVQLNLGGEVLVSGSAHELREVVTNIVLNSVQAMPEGGSISVETGRDDVHSWVTISDSGLGMDDVTKKRIFDPFFTTRGVEGTGLGMSVAYGIIKRHGGRIEVESAPGEGTTIRIFLPAVEEPGGRVSKDTIVTASTVQPARILVVDDEAKFVEVLVEMLESIGHTAVVAGSGPEAIEKFAGGGFDLVFTDLGMPGMLGWQVAESIKSVDPKMPVVLLTGWGAGLEASDERAKHVDMVLAKPVRLDKLSSIVEEALTRK